MAASNLSQAFIKHGSGMDSIAKFSIALPVNPVDIVKFINIVR